MPAMPVKCPHCRKRFDVTLAETGLLVRCPSCDNKFPATDQRIADEFARGRKCLICGRLLNETTGMCPACPPRAGAPDDNASPPTTSVLWGRLFQVEGGLLPELILFVLGWVCTGIEIVLQTQGPEAAAWGSPGVTVILVLVVVMLVIWCGSAIRKWLNGEYGGHDFGSLTLVIAASSALFWAHHVQYGGEDQTVPPVVVLCGSVVLQLAASVIVLWPLVRQK
jgi:predicted Zn finger-like uncharacterized protein